MTDIVEETRKLLAEATPGPWAVGDDDTNAHAVVAGRDSRGRWVYVTFPEHDRDAALIAAAPALLAKLADEVERLRAELEEAKHSAWERSERD